MLFDLPVAAVDTEISYTGDGSTKIYSFPFPYLNASSVNVTLGGKTNTGYTIDNTNTIQFSAISPATTEQETDGSPKSGVKVRIFRVTEASIVASFYPGSSIRAKDLNDNFTQNLYSTQESNSKSDEALESSRILESGEFVTAIDKANEAEIAHEAFVAKNYGTTASPNWVTRGNEGNDSQGQADTERGVGYAIAQSVSAVGTAAAAVSTANTARDNSVKTGNAPPGGANAAITIAEAAEVTADAAVDTADEAKLATDTYVHDGTNLKGSGQNGQPQGVKYAVDKVNDWIVNGDGLGGNEEGVPFAVQQSTDAVADASAAVVTANAAAATVSEAVLFTPVADKAALEALTPTADGHYQVTDSAGLANGSLGSAGHSIAGISGAYPTTQLDGITTRFDYTHSSKTYTFQSYFANDGDDRYMVGPATDGSNGDFLQTNGAGVKTWTSTFISGINVADGIKITLGDGGNNDYSPGSYEIYESNDLFIKSNGGHMRHQLTGSGTGVLIENPGVSSIAKFIEGGACELYYDQATHTAAKLETTATGVNIPGQLDVTDIEATGNIRGKYFTSDNASCLKIYQYDGSGNPDTVDGRTYTSVYSSIETHDAEDLFMELHEDTIFEIKSPDSYPNDSTDHGRLASFKPQEGVKLFYNDVKKIETTTGGVDVTGTLDASGDLTVNTDALFVDASAKKVGIGTASPAMPLEITGTVTAGTDTNQDLQQWNIGSDNVKAEIKYDDGGDPSVDRGYVFGTSSGHDLTFQTNDTKRLRIDYDGNVRIGGTLPSAPATTITAAGAINTSSHIYTGSKYTNGTGGFLSSFGSLLLRCDDGSDYLNFYTGGNDAAHVKAKITNAGAATFAGEVESNKSSAGSSSILFQGNSDIGQNAGTLVEKFKVTADGSATFKGNITTGDFDTSSTGVGGARMTASGYIDAQRIDTGSSDGHALYQGFHGNVMTFITRADGDVENANNSYGQYSDIKLKENVVDANSQWNNIKDIRVRNFNFIEGQTHTQIGVIAQEIETVSPGLVSESPDTDKDGNDLGTVTKSVKYSVLYMKAIKALQEAMTRIETLETKVAALEAA